jgi:hypothetical protein
MYAACRLLSHGLASLFVAPTKYIPPYRLRNLFWTVLGDCEPNEKYCTSTRLIEHLLVKKFFILSRPKGDYGCSWYEGRLR